MMSGGRVISVSAALIGLVGGKPIVNTSAFKVSGPTTMMWSTPRKTHWQARALLTMMVSTLSPPFDHTRLQPIQRFGDFRTVPATIDY